MERDTIGDLDEDEDNEEDGEADGDGEATPPLTVIWGTTNVCPHPFPRYGM